MSEQISLDLAKLWCQYYIYVKKMQNIDFTTTFTEEEMHDINETCYRFLNHFADDEPKKVEDDEIKNSCDANIEQTNGNAIFSE